MPKKEEMQETGVSRLPAEEWSRRKGTPAWAFAAAKTKAGWALGQEVTEEEYERAVRAALEEVIRNA